MNATINPILGIDLCPHALALAEQGQSPAWEHVRRCPICLPRWHMAEAELQGWQAVSHAQAGALLEQMAAHFVKRPGPVSTAEERGFWAHLVECEDCEADIAAAVAAEQVPAALVPASPPLVLPRPLVTRFWEWVKGGLQFAQWDRQGVLGGPEPAFASSAGSRRYASADPPGVAISLSAADLDLVYLDLQGAPDAEMVTLRIRRKEQTAAMPVMVRLYRGIAGQEAAPALDRELTLATEQTEIMAQLARAAFERGRVEVDVPE